MKTEGGNREQYEHILAQATLLDRAAQINLLLDLAAQMRQSPDTGLTVALEAVCAYWRGTSDYS